MRDWETLILDFFQGVGGGGGGGQEEMKKEGVVNLFGNGFGEC